MYTTNEKMIVNVIIDDVDFQDRLFTRFSAEECKDLVGSLMEVEILHRTYGFCFNQYVQKVHNMFGEEKGDILIDLMAKMRLAKKELVLSTEEKLS